MGTNVGIDQELIDALKDPDPFVRAGALARIESDDRTTAALAFALGDDYPLVRREAVRALGRVASPDAARALLEAAAHDFSAEVREEAVIALGLIARLTIEETARLAHDANAR